MQRMRKARYMPWLGGVSVPWSICSSHAGAVSKQLNHSLSNAEARSEILMGTFSTDLE